MRELCKMGIEGFAFQRTPAEQFVNCLPNQYRKHGYNTIALHGASSQIYDRFSLYPKMGFQQFITSESLMGKKHCEAFNGICDTELLDTVKKQFAQQDRICCKDFCQAIRFTWYTTISSTYLYTKYFAKSDLSCEDHSLCLFIFSLDQSLYIE